LPAPTNVWHVVINEGGPFGATPAIPSVRLPGLSLAEYRIKSYALFLSNGTTEWLAARGTSIGANKIVAVNGKNITRARLEVVGTWCPTISEFHLLPW
jgi:hypothetical protein